MRRRKSIYLNNLVWVFIRLKYHRWDCVPCQYRVLNIKWKCENNKLMHSFRCNFTFKSIKTKSLHCFILLICQRLSFVTIKWTICNLNTETKHSFSETAFYIITISSVFDSLVFTPLINMQSRNNNNQNVITFNISNIISTAPNRFSFSHSDRMQSVSFFAKNPYKRAW